MADVQGRPSFFDPRGGTHFEGRWQPPQLPERALEAMIEENQGAAAARPTTAPDVAGSCAPAPDGATASAAEPGGPAAGARWKREADIPDDIYFRALEAID